MVDARSSLLVRYRHGATLLRIPLSEYIEHVENGEKWCYVHRAWESRSVFPPRKGRIDGLDSACRNGIKLRHKDYIRRNPKITKIRTQEDINESRRISRMRANATLMGISEDEYRSHIDRNERWCGWHKVWEPSEGFHNKHSVCKRGHNERMNAYRAANRERLNTYARVKLREYREKRRRVKTDEA